MILRLAFQYYKIHPRFTYLMSKQVFPTLPSPTTTHLTSFIFEFGTSVTLKIYLFKFLTIFRLLPLKLLSHSGKYILSSFSNYVNTAGFCFRNNLEGYHSIVLFRHSLTLCKKREFFSQKFN